MHFRKRAARLKIVAAVAVLEGRAPANVDDRIYDLKSAQACIDEGVSEEHELRLFEIGWGADGIVFVNEPLFLLAQPGRLVRLWARAQGMVRP